MSSLFWKCIGLIGTIYFVLKYCLSYWKRRGILHEKPKLLWGNLKGVGHKRHIVAAIRRVYENYKQSEAPFVGFYALMKPFVLLLDLELVRRVLISDKDNFSAESEPLFYCCLSPQLSSKDWHAIRDSMLRLFDNPTHLNELHAVLLRVVDDFKESLKLRSITSDEVLNIYELANAYNKDICQSLCLGVPLRNSPSNFTAKYVLLKSYISLQFPTLWRLIRNGLKRNDEGQRVHSSYVSFMEERFSQPKPTSSLQGSDVLLQLLAEQLPERETGAGTLAAQMEVFQLVNLQTCNAALTFALYELALQPEIQAKVRAELIAALNRHNERLNMSILSELPYLKQVLYETLRKHSPYPFLLRHTIKDYEVPDSVFMLCAGNHLIIPTAAIHYDDRLYPKPEKFDPDRFTPGISQRHPMSWLPFGCAPDNCELRQLFETQLLLGLAALLRYFKFSPAAGTPVPLEYNNEQLLLSPRAKVMLRLQPA